MKTGCLTNVRSTNEIIEPDFYVTGSIFDLTAK